MRNISSNFTRKFRIYLVLLGIFLLDVSCVFPHGVDTYNLLVKLFVEEYHSRYAQNVKLDQGQWAAYPLEKRYASFEDVYYLYLLSLADPLLQSFPPPRNVKIYEDSIVFIVMEKPPKGTPAKLGRIPLENFTLQWGDKKPHHAQKILSDPIQEYKILKNSRSSSRLLLFAKPEEGFAVKNGPASTLELKISLSDPGAVASFSWDLPDGFPQTDDKYESEIWTVAREQYALMPMPVHQSTASK